MEQQPQLVQGHLPAAEAVSPGRLELQLWQPRHPNHLVGEAKPLHQSLTQTVFHGRYVFGPKSLGLLVVLKLNVKTAIQ